MIVGKRPATAWAVTAALLMAAPSPAMAQGPVVKVLPKPAKTPAARPRPPQQAVLTGPAYATAVGTARNCQQIAAAATSIPDAGPLLRSLRMLSKGEFETTPEFIARYRQDLSTAVGGADMIVLKRRLEPSELTYDADRGIMKLSGSAASGLVENAGCRDRYCIGESVAWETGERLEFSALELPIEREQAKAAKDSSELVVAVSIRFMTLSPGRYGSRFTADFTGRCAFLLNGGSPILTSTDGWFNIVPKSAAQPPAE